MDGSTNSGFVTTYHLDNNATSSIRCPECGGYYESTRGHNHNRYVQVVDEGEALSSRSPAGRQATRRQSVLQLVTAREKQQRELWRDKVLLHCNTPPVYTNRKKSKGLKRRPFRARQLQTG